LQGIFFPPRANPLNRRELFDNEWINGDGARVEKASLRCISGPWMIDQDGGIGEA
jgi:hypothetical protein